MPSDEYTRLAVSTTFGKPHRNTPKLKTSGKDAVKDVCTMLNNICHGGDYENDVPEADIRSMLEKILSEGKNAVKWQERQGMGRITRTARKVWERKMVGPRGQNRIVRSDGNGGEVIVVAQDVPDEEMTLEDAISADAWAAIDRQREERGDDRGEDRGRNVGRHDERVSQIENLNSTKGQEDGGRDDRWRKEYASGHRVANNSRQSVVGVQRRVTWDDGGFDPERRQGMDDFQTTGRRDASVNQSRSSRDYRVSLTGDFFGSAPTMRYEKYKSAAANGSSASANNSRQQDTASRTPNTNAYTRRAEYCSGTSRGRETVEGDPDVSSAIANYDTSTSQRTPSWGAPGPYEDPHVQTVNKPPSSLSYGFIRSGSYDNPYRNNRSNSNTFGNISSRPTMKYTGPQKNIPQISGKDENAMQAIEFTSSKSSAQTDASKEISNSSGLKRGDKTGDESGNITKPNFHESFPDGIRLSHEEMRSGILSSRHFGADKEKSTHTGAKFVSKPSEIGLKASGISNDTTSSKETLIPSSGLEEKVFPSYSGYRSLSTPNDLLCHRTETTGIDLVTFNDEGMVDFSSGGGFQFAGPSSTPAHVSLAAPASSVSFEAGMNPARLAMLAQNSKTIDGDEMGARMDWEGDDEHYEGPLKKKHGKWNQNLQTNNRDAADGGKRGGRGGMGENAIPLPFNRLARE
jgi:hypothetical protein